jgi:hypothetical protein
LDFMRFEACCRSQKNKNFRLFQHVIICAALTAAFMCPMPTQVVMNKVIPLDSGGIL